MELLNVNAATDEELLLAVTRHNLEAFEEFYERHHRTALAVAFRVLDDAALAEDAVQEAFVAVWRQARSYSRDRGRARTWLLSIARHRAIDMTRGKAFKLDAASLDRLPIQPAASDLVETVFGNLVRDELRHAVESLPAEQRRAVDLAYFRGYTNREISDKTGVPLGTVKGRIRLGMRKLRGLLAKREGEDSH